MIVAADVLAFGTSYRTAVLPFLLALPWLLLADRERRLEPIGPPEATR